MTKYTIKVIKESGDKNPNSLENFDMVLFQADMEADSTVEILSHLHSLLRSESASESKAKIM